LASAESAALLAASPALAIHQMHDPNQDRLMVRNIAYFRMKMLALTATYRRFIARTLAPGGTILIVNTSLKWPVSRRRGRHVYQEGAVGGIAPEEYVHGSPRVARFLAEQDAKVRGWQFPPATEWAPEAEWGYEPALGADVRSFAAREGYRVEELCFETPDAMGPVVADAYQDWYAANGRPARRLLTETFICTEPGWALGTNTVPLWLTFGTEPSLETFAKYLANGSTFDEVAITLFAHGVRSAGYAAADRWLQVARDHGAEATFAGVDPHRWPSDFATLATYGEALHRLAPSGPRPRPMSLDHARAAVERFGPPYGVTWLRG
jgi:hypothetical protein